MRSASRSLLLTAALFLAAASARCQDYDVSYFWHPDLSSANLYRDKLAALFGPGLAKALEVVKGSDNFGVIYRRRGGLDSARAVAKAHSRILSAKGLDPAVPIKDADWGKPEAAAVPAARDGAAEAIERKIERYVKSLRRSGRVKSDERTAWSAYDFSSDEKLVSINEDMPVDAASLIKPFIALAWMHEVRHGRRRYGSAERRRMIRMIRDSDNLTADWFMKRLGGPAGVDRILKRNYGTLFRETRIVEYIPASGRTFRNEASAHDYSRFLYALWTGGLPGSEEIKRIMNMPNPDRLYTSVPGVPVGTEVYDKTGTTSRLCGNIGVMVARRGDGKEFPYIIVGLIEKSRSARRYSNWMRSRGDVIRRISEMVYDEIARMHDFEDFSAPISAGSGERTGHDENS